MVILTKCTLPQIHSEVVASNYSTHCYQKTVVSPSALDLCSSVTFGDDGEGSTCTEIFMLCQGSPSRLTLIQQQFWYAR